MAVESYLDEQERQRLEARYAEIAQLAGALAHEIKNPLSTISLNLELLTEDLAESEQPRDRRMLSKLQTLQRECRHLEQILNEFLQFTRVRELALVEADLNDVVREFIAFYGPRADEQGIELSPHLATDLPPVRVDRALLRQVLLNLVLNAEQAMPAGGVLELQTCQRDGRVSLEIIDNGTGMEPQTQSRMFEPFFSTKPGGSGLGLPTVRKIVEAHHGTITCESAPGRGTRLTIALPACG